MTSALRFRQASGARIACRPPAGVPVVRRGPLTSALPPRTRPLLVARGTNSTHAGDTCPQPPQRWCRRNPRPSLSQTLHQPPPTKSTTPACQLAAAPRPPLDAAAAMPRRAVGPPPRVGRRRASVSRRSVRWRWRRWLLRNVASLWRRPHAKCPLLKDFSARASARVRHRHVPTTIHEALPPSVQYPLCTLSFLRWCSSGAHGGGAHHCSLSW